MKLLVITQKVDKNDPVLGFFHNWLIKLSEKFEYITVICLEKRAYQLSANVKVLSLGKEKIERKLDYIVYFYKYIWQERKNYDAVFVHMNQEYVILGWKFWKLWGKNIYLWRNHKRGNILTRFAVLVSDKVFATSKDSFTARFKKTILMPVGIDTELFKPHSSSVTPHSILFLGRISPVKNVLLFINALNILKQKEVDFRASIYGDVLPKDEGYLKNVKEKVKEFGLEEHVIFYAGVPNTKTPEIYSNHSIYVNLTPSGSFDKTILEAAACGALPIIVNKSLESVPEFSYLIAEENAEDIANNMIMWLKAEDEIVRLKLEALRAFVEKNHSLSLLTERIAQIVR